MRAAVAMLVVVVGACRSTQRYTIVTTPPDALRAAIATPGDTIRDDTGKVTHLDQVQTVVLPREPPLAEVNTTIEKLASACNPGAQDCPLEQRHVFAQLLIPAGTEYNIKSSDLEIGVLVGAVAAGEAYCFAKCSTGPKVGLVVSDVVMAIILPFALQLARGLAN